MVAMPRKNANQAKFYVKEGGPTSFYFEKTLSSWQLAKPGNKEQNGVSHIIEKQNLH